MHTAKKMYEIGGLRTFWTGFGPTLLRDVPFSSLYWLLYETLRKDMTVSVRRSHRTPFLFILVSRHSTSSFGGCGDVVFVFVSGGGGCHVMFMTIIGAMGFHVALHIPFLGDSLRCRSFCWNNIGFSHSSY